LEEHAFFELTTETYDDSEGSLDLKEVFIYSNDAYNDSEDDCDDEDSIDF